MWTVSRSRSAEAIRSLVSVNTVAVNTVTEAETQPSALIEGVVNGEEVTIAKAGKPVAVLKKFEPGKQKRAPGALRGQIKIADDFDTLPNRRQLRVLALALRSLRYPGLRRVVKPFVSGITDRE
jgi:antitoxin (DNA-binding transcriptional repressor) of toxin-antitoxin stability system